MNIARTPGFRWWLAAQNFHLPKNRLVISCNVSGMEVEWGRIAFKGGGWW